MSLFFVGTKRVLGDHNQREDRVFHRSRSLVIYVPIAINKFEGGSRLPMLFVCLTGRVHLPPITSIETTNLRKSPQKEVQDEH